MNIDDLKPQDDASANLPTMDTSQITVETPVPASSMGSQSPAFSNIPDAPASPVIEQPTVAPAPAAPSVSAPVEEPVGTPALMPEPTLVIEDTSAPAPAPVAPAPVVSEQN